MRYLPMKRLIGSGILVLLFASCKKTTNDTIQSTIPHVYITGTIYDTATLWIDSLETRLPLKGTYSRGRSVFVSGNNVYVAGADEGAAALWKNSVETILGNTSTANSVFVAGNDTYVAGVANGYAVYWKNGVENRLQRTPGRDHGYANSIFVVGSDVYVAGELYPSDINIQNGIATYWKNNVPTELVSDSIFSKACSIFVVDTTIYIAGLISHIGFQATYWKNGVPTTLATSSSIACSICVSGSDVFIKGTQWVNGTYMTTFWKNGIATYLSPGQLDTDANSIFVFGKDVYMAGTIWNLPSSYNAGWWKNGNPVIIGPYTNVANQSLANSIFVK